MLLPSNNFLKCTIFLFFFFSPLYNKNAGPPCLVFLSSYFCVTTGLVTENCDKQKTGSLNTDSAAAWTLDLGWPNQKIGADRCCPAHGYWEAIAQKEVVFFRKGTERNWISGKFCVLMVFTQRHKSRGLCRGASRTHPGNVHMIRL